MNRARFRVIVADDEKLIARNIANNIMRVNSAFEVVSIAADGQEAYELTQKLLPDIVFSDIKMPVLDGLALITKINAEFPAIKTVIISGYNDFELVRSALQQHTMDYLLKPISPYDLQKTLRKMEQELSAQKKEFNKCSEERPADIAESIKAYLRHNYADQINFSQIAEQYGFSAAYLSKIFKEYVGISPGKYLNEYRINISKKLLLDTDLPIKIVAEKVGYFDQFHFSKSFKNAVGLSPAQFREQLL